MRVTVCQFDNRSHVMEESWRDLAAYLKDVQPDFLLMPEMPFHDWLAASKEPSVDAWHEAMDIHQARIDRLPELNVPAVLFTTPQEINKSFKNTATLWTEGEGATGFHSKWNLPNEESYWEATWYDRGDPTFDVARVGTTRIGVQICTEMWFFEHSRAYSKAGTHLLCVPRATPHGSVEKWLAGGQAAAVVSGSFCLSSNLYNPPGSAADIGGLSWVIDPEGNILARTSVEQPYATVEIDLNEAEVAKSTYPRYVPD